VASLKRGLGGRNSQIIDAGGHAKEKGTTWVDEQSRSLSWSSLLLRLHCR
jgi:hypothetical protein